MLQPLVGYVTDRYPTPYSLVLGMGSSLLGLIVMAFASTYALVLVAAGLIGMGSSVFHPESSRVARLASGGQHGLAQSVFQVGGNFGTALGPLLAAFVVLPYGQAAIAWFSIVALIAMVCSPASAPGTARRSSSTKGGAGRASARRSTS